MPYYRAPFADSTKILTRSELRTVLADVRQRAARSPSARLNLILLRLAACCGLRVSEITQLTIADVRTVGTRPHLRITRGAAKGGRPRNVPLWWDAGTLEDIAAWKAQRLEAGYRETNPFLASLRPGRQSRRYSRHTLRRRGSALRAKRWAWSGWRR